MSWKGRRRRPAAAWLGVVALALNALVPIHFAFDLAEALAAAPAKHAQGHAHQHPDGRSLLALLTGHHHAADHEHQPSGDHHKAPACAVCSAVSALAGFAPTGPAIVVVVVAADLPSIATEIAGRTYGISSAYRARAPPAV